MRQYLNFGRFSRQTPQSEPIPGSTQSPNNAGGFGWVVDDRTRLLRFLILGSANGSYYASSRALTKQNLDVVERMLREGRGEEVINAIVEVSKAGRASSNDPALFALARCAACDVHGKKRIEIPTERIHYMHRRNHADFFERFPDENVPQTIKGRTFTRIGDTITIMTKVPPGTIRFVDHPDDVIIRQKALAVLPKVARTGTHLLHFLAYVKEFRGWGPTLRKAVANWYNESFDSYLAFQVLKYQRRDGYSHKDSLRLSHPKTSSATHNTIYHWITKGWDWVGEEPHPDFALQKIWAFEKGKRSKDAQEIAQLISRYQLPREAVLTEFLNDSRIWESLLEHMPLEALTRNLANMTRGGIIAPLDEHTRKIADRLTDEKLIHHSRLHPLKILTALQTYCGGKSIRGDHTWKPNAQIIEALNRAFYSAFKNVEPTNKKILIAIDVSDSMSWHPINGLPNMTTYMAAGCLALLVARTEPNHHIIGIDNQIYEIRLHAYNTLEEIADDLSKIGHGGTNLSLPFHYALAKHLWVDCFVILSDSETWQGGYHPSQLLQRYRNTINPDAKVVNVQMVANHVTNNYPDDTRALEIAGFDTNIPVLINEFIKGNI